MNRLHAQAIPNARCLGPSPEEWDWDETIEGDPDGTIEFDADLAFELLGDR